MPKSNTICVWHADSLSALGPSRPLAYLLEDGYAHSSLGPAETAPVRIEGDDPLAFLIALWSKTREGAYTDLDAGQYHPRMFRGDSEGVGFPTVERRGESEYSEFLTSVEQEGILCDELASICRVVQPSPENVGTYGAKIRNLLITTCTEVESQLKGVLTSNGCVPQGSRWSTQDYVRVAAPMRLDQFAVRIVRYRNYAPISPFKGWDVAAPTKSLPWYDAYNETKHDRQAHIDRATLGHVLSAVAALNVLLIAQYGMVAINRYPIAFPFFSVEQMPEWQPRERSYAPVRGRAAVATNFPF